MKSTALCAASLFFLFAATPAPDSAEGFIRALYARDQPAKNKSIDWCNRKTISKYADAHLTNLFIKDCECAKRSGEICQLDMDPFYAAQDFEDADPDLRIQPMDADAYEVTIKNYGDKKLIYRMQRTSAGWRVSDIEYPADKSSLVKVLSGR